MHPEGILPLPLTENLQSQKYRQRDFFSADLYYNDMHSKQKVSVISHCRAGACSRRSKQSLTENWQAQKYRRRGCFPLPIHVIMIWGMKMDKEKELPQRKHPRLDNYDYGSAGAYFVTICTQNRRCVLSRIVGRGLAPIDGNLRD